MIFIAEGPWALIRRRFHRLDSPSLPSRTLCGVEYHHWVWDAPAVKGWLERPKERDRPLKKKVCQTCEQRAARLARIAAGTALFMPARVETPEEAEERIRRRRAQDLAELDRQSRRLSRSNSTRAARGGLPGLGRQ